MTSSSAAGSILTPTRKCSPPCLARTCDALVSIPFDLISAFVPLQPPCLACFTCLLHPEVHESIHTLLPTRSCPHAPIPLAPPQVGVTGHGGFAKLSAADAAHAVAHRQKLAVPPGHMLIFNEKLMHEVCPAAPATPSHTILRLFTGWRLTTAKTPQLGQTSYRTMGTLQRCASRHASLSRARAIHLSLCLSRYASRAEAPAIRSLVLSQEPPSSNQRSRSRRCAASSRGRRPTCTRA